MSRLPEELRRRSGRVGSDPFEDLDSLMQEAGLPAAPGHDDSAAADSARTGASSPGDAAQRGRPPSLDAVSPIACPYLGLAGDPDTHFSVPDEAHVCYGTHRRSYIPGAYQRANCLDWRYTTCVVFLAVQQGHPPAAPWDDQRASGAKGLLQRVLRRR